MKDSTLKLTYARQRVLRAIVSIGHPPSNTRRDMLGRLQGEGLINPMGAGWILTHKGMAALKHVEAEDACRALASRLARI